MRGTIRDRLSLDARARLIGRSGELDTLRHALARGSPVVVHLHGLPGAGKTALATAFAEEVRSSGGTVVAIDCGAVEPTERGLAGELGRLLECNPACDEIADALAARPPPVLILFDGYEVFRLLDAWLRQHLIPSLPERVLVLLVSRLPPSGAWTEAPAWQDLFATLPLGGLSDRDATELLARFDVAGDDVPGIVELAAGHPLALTLAARAARLPKSDGSASPAREATLSQLAGRYLEGIGDAPTRRALRTSSVARRINRGLLRALSTEGDADALYDRLAELPFVVLTRDGLSVHEAVREALAAELLASDPELYRTSRLQAWQHVSAEARTSTFNELWRCTADLIHLLRNPVVREAFFPRDAERFAIEPARADDRDRILAITEAHDGPVAASCMELWWRTCPDAFHVARTRDESVEGFYCLLDAAAVMAAPDALAQDPVARRFAQDLHENPMPRRHTALFLRRWLARDAGEQPSPVQAACWLDVKRHYLEKRPLLRRVYLALEAFDPYASVAGALGFSALPNAVALGNRLVQAAVLDMGPGSVDGWLLRLAAQELGIPPDTRLLDPAKRALHVNGKLVPLTRREFDVMAYLVAREGEAVPRDGLIEDVWGLRFDPGSNVVDVVVASLRRKLGGRSGAIETVRGFGYAYHSGSASVGSVLA